MKAVVNASPLIFLAKLDRLDLLPSPCATTSVVLAEIRRGAPEGHPEAVSVEALLDSDHLHVLEPTKHRIPEQTGLHPGERSVLALARERGVPEVIVDDKLAIRTTKVVGLRPVSTVYLLLRARKTGTLTSNGYRDLLERIVGHGYYPSAPLYQRLLQAGK